MENPAKQAYSYRKQEYSSIENPWEWWNAFRIVCDYDRKIGIALIVSHDLPEQEEVLSISLFSMCNTKYMKKSSMIKLISLQD